MKQPLTDKERAALIRFLIAAKEFFADAEPDDQRRAEKLVDSFFDEDMPDG